MRFNQVDADTQSGRPKKFIDIAMVGQPMFMAGSLMYLCLFVL